MSFVFREIERDFLAPVLPVDEVVDHVHRARAVEGVQRDEIVETVGLVAAQNVAHAGGFELEDSAGEAFGEDRLVCCGIIERNVLNQNFLPAMTLDQPKRIVHNGERGEPEEIHLEKAKLVKTVHVILRDNFVFVCLVERDNVP